MPETPSPGGRIAALAILATLVLGPVPPALAATAPARPPATAAQRARPMPAVLAHRPGGARAWGLLAKAAAWSDALRAPGARYWLEFRTQLPCAAGGAGERGLVVRVARAGDARLAYDVFMEPGPAGVRFRCDGRRCVEHSLSGGTFMVTPGPLDSVRATLAGEAGMFAVQMAQGLAIAGIVASDTERVARWMGPDSLVVDGRVRRCERVRLEPHARSPRERAEEFWIDVATGCPWRFATVDRFGAPLAHEAAVRYAFFRTGVPPESLFATALPAGAVVVNDLEATRPHPVVDAALRPQAGADSTVTFRWAGVARSVELVGSFNCWDPHADPMSRGGDGTWTRTRAVSAGAFNDYLFLIDGRRWVLDPRNPGCRGDGFGGWMSVISGSSPRR